MSQTFRIVITFSSPLEHVVSLPPEYNHYSTLLTILRRLLVLYHHGGMVWLVLSNRYEVVVQFQVK
jgi:hypothetical protein